LHVLESGTLRPVGASRERRVSLRVIAATHRNLRERVAEGAFREDLFFRLDVVSLEIPPLRKRREDIPALVQQFIAAARERHPHSPVQGLTPAAMARLLEHAWPGNVRELKHLIERVVLLGQHAQADLGELPASITAPDPMLASLMSGKVIPVAEVTQRYAAWALEQFNGHRGHTAAALDISPKTLSAWLREKS
jgi:DNA-binding NtrC family response regulator